MQFEPAKNAFERFVDTDSLKLVDEMATGLAANFVNAAVMSKKISLLGDIKYMVFYGCSLVTL